MIPIRLRLENFLSYGTAAQPLDFEQFHVACLSGKNGQGKSALLDAITWALWGEARKSSGGHKPDDELIRIGTRHMEVELTFDIEGERYRVVRTYSRSASGKTNKPGLELHVGEPGSWDFRPLTCASIRETQEHLDTLLGLDYDTFINSAFLLQGRSDEFTKKRPNERKQILSRILNLGRYDRLADLARDRAREQNERLRFAEQEIGRLQEALEPEATWKEEKATLSATAEQLQNRLADVLAREQRLSAQRAALDAQAREADTTRAAVAALDKRQADDREEVEGVMARIEKAHALIAQREQILKDHDRYEALLAERKELDTKSELHRGLERQLDQRNEDLKDRSNEVERRLHNLDYEIKKDQASLAECEAQLIEAPVVRSGLKAAREASDRLMQMGATRQQKERLTEQARACEQELSQMQTALHTQKAAIEKQIRDEARALPDLALLQLQHRELAESQRRLERLEVQLEETRAEGQQVGEALTERSGRLEHLQQECERQRTRLEALTAVEEGTCPTCGTTLSPEHKHEVEEVYRDQLGALQEEIARLRRTVREMEEKREALRTQFRQLRQQCEALSGVLERRLNVEAQLTQAGLQREKIEGWAEKVKVLHEQLESEAYGPAVKERLKGIRGRLDGLGFDEEQFQALQQDAAQVTRFEERLNVLEHVGGRKERLTSGLEQKRKEADELRKQLGEGTVFKELHEQIRRLKDQLQRIGFSHERYHAVRKELDGLEQAGAWLKELMHAQENQSQWQAQCGRIKERIAERTKEREALVEKLNAITEKLEGKPVLEAEILRVAAERAGIQDEIQGAQRLLGKVNERLEQAARDRKTLHEKRTQHRGAEAQRALYTHLRTAFGKNGIPSLIIEQTLPEIEDRANELLGQLTDGRMHVRLETLKDKKTGGTRETLEIKISDEQGVSRPYETFSGGEAFRVNFALRIALAQLLAERSGVRIRTLVIDEGFGTQDAQGVQSMVEAIQAIQDDFDKIMVITHLDQLKEAFPVRIEVSKDPAEGSSFEVLTG